MLIMLYIDIMTVYANPAPFNFTDITNDDFFNGDYAFNNNSINDQYDHLKTITRLIENDNYRPEISRDVNRENIVSEDTVNTPLPSPQKLSLQEKLILNHQEISNKISELKEEKSNLEKSYEWKFMTDPERYPCNYQWVFKASDLNITTNVRFSSIQDRDRLLSDNFDDRPIDIPKLNFFDPKPFYNAIERNAELSARNYLLATQERHTRLTKEIQSNESELRNIKISFTESSLLTIPTPVIPVHNGSSVSDEKIRIDTNFAQAIENKLNAAGDKLAETFECTFGFACASDLDKAAKNPNLGKDLSNSDKVELGGTGSGTPDGWGPQDEERFRNNPEQPVFTEDYLVSSANKPINNQGLSAAARAWEKHAGRPNGIFEPLAGNPIQKNAVAEQFIKSVLRDPLRVKNNLSGGAFEYRLPNGKGIRYNADGSFNTVLDPKVKK